MKVLLIRSLSQLKHLILADFEENYQLNIEKIIEIYNPYLYTILKNCLCNSEDIEEILSDVFLILWKNFEKLDKTMELKPYLVGIAKNLIRKKYRTSCLSNRFETIETYENRLSDSIDVPYLLEQNEKSKLIQHAIELMKPQEQQIFMMFYYQSKKIKEIAKFLAISEIKVKVTLHRLRKFVKKILKEGGYDYANS